MIIVTLISSFRSILTIQALHDFYYTLIKRLPPNDRLISKELTKICRESEDTSGSKKGGEDKVYRQLKNAYQELQLKDIQIDYSNNPFNMIIENNVKFAVKVVKELNDSYRSLISKEYSEIAKMVPTVKKKDDNASITDSINQEEVYKHNALKCIDEWIMGINGEMYQASLRIMALQYKCYQDMKLFNDHIYKTFMEVQDDINTYYMNEIRSVDRLCKYLQMAVEDGRKIPESLILEHDMFIIDPNLLQFAPPEPPVDTGIINEIADDLEFKVAQLARLRSQFKIVAPTGIALQQAFIYLLQDFVFFGKESCDGPLFPECWKRIDPEKIPKLVYSLFGDMKYVDWRDFLIYCLNLRSPTVEELLCLRKKFRCYDLNSTELISRDNFINEELWFEDDFDPQDKYAMLRKALIKHFIFELFETSENMMNYSAFLLAFCKRIDPIEGFAAALSMAVGKKTCFSPDECEKVICHLVKLKQYRDESLACAYKCTSEFLDAVITHVINFCEGTTLTDIPYSEQDDNVKGKKRAAKMKRIESSSARLPKAKSKTIMSKSKVQSAIDIKTTFICRPCEEEPAVEEKPPEIENVEEEHEPEVQPDSDLAYAVSQDVIWNVLKICLPWHFQLLPEEKVTPYVKWVKEAMERLQENTDNKDIYVAMFVADSKVCKLLNKVKKFTALNIVDEIRKVSL